jgi:apolipoprotein N-acyltransferase
MRRFEASTPEQALPVVNAYLDAAHTLAARRVEAVVLPEKMVGVAPAYEDEVARQFSSLAERDEVLLVAGLNLVGRRQPRNVAAVFSRGRKVLEYDKRRLVPGVEAEYAAGQAAGVYRAPGGMTGVAICKDMDFAELGREYGRAGVGLLFVPAWDFTRDARMHSRMAVLRGVEGGYSVARAAANGLLTGSDDLGQVLAERPSDAATQSMLLVALPLGRGKTFYSEHGDWFAGLCLAGAAGLLALSLALAPKP